VQHLLVETINEKRPMWTLDELVNLLKEAQSDLLVKLNHLHLQRSSFSYVSKSCNYPSAGSSSEKNFRDKLIGSLLHSRKLALVQALNICKIKITLKKILICKGLI
jgi:hypothetical protein